MPVLKQVKRTSWWHCEIHFVSHADVAKLYSEDQPTRVELSEGAGTRLCGEGRSRVVSPAGLWGLSKSQQVFRRCTAQKVCRDFGWGVFFRPKVFIQAVLLSFRQHVGAQAGGSARWVSLLLFCFSRVYSVPPFEWLYLSQIWRDLGRCFGGDNWNFGHSA